MSIGFLNNRCADCGRPAKELREIKEFAGLVRGIIEFTDEEGNHIKREGPVPDFVNVRDVCYSCYKRAVREDIQKLRQGIIK